MGIRKFLNFVRQEHSIHFDAMAFEAGDTLLIDANGFSFWFLESGLFSEDLKGK